MAPPNARMMTSWIFMARSRAAAASTIVTSLIDDGCSATPGKSGHFTCSRERTDHVLPTRRATLLAPLVLVCYAFAREVSAGWPPPVGFEALCPGARNCADDVSDGTLRGARRARRCQGRRRAGKPRL